MSRRSIALLALVIGLTLSWAVRPDEARALELTVVSQTVEADFPAGLTMTIDYESDRPIDEAFLLYALAEEDVTYEVGAQVAADGESEASAFIDMELAFVPAGVDLTYRWRLVAADDSEAETESQTIIWQDDRFEWERSAADDIEVFSYAGGEGLRNDVVRSAQETADRLSEEFSVTVEHPLRIWVYDSKKDFDGTLASNSQEWAAGAAYPDLQLILAVLPAGRPTELGRIIPHEVSHQLLEIATDNPYNQAATWLDEGIAVRNQTNGTGEMDRLVAAAKREDRLLPLTSLNAGFPFEPSDASLAYAQGFSVVSYLVETYGEPVLAAIATAYRAGSTHDDAVRAGTGRDIAQLDDEWQASIDADLGATVDRDAIARVLVYGAPGIGVVAYLVARRRRHEDPYPDEEEAVA